MNFITTHFNRSSRSDSGRNDSSRKLNRTQSIDLDPMKNLSDDDSEAPMKAHPMKSNRYEDSPQKVCTSFKN